MEKTNVITISYNRSREILSKFIHTILDLIEKQGVLPKSIVSTDQSSHFFKTEPNSTIISKRSREVLKKKGGTYHKRFTAIFAIKFLKCHFCSQI
jgi:hypothetical protein